MLSDQGEEGVKERFEDYLLGKENSCKRDTAYKFSPGFEIQARGDSDEITGIDNEFWNERSISACSHF